MSGGERMPGPGDEASEERRFRLRVAEEHAERLEHAEHHEYHEHADPRTAAVFEALDRTRAHLAAAPAPPLPPHVLAGIDRALAAERTGEPVPPPPSDQLTAEAEVDRGSAPPRPVDHEPRPARRTRRRVLVAAAAVLVVLGAVAGVTVTMARGPAPALPVVHRDDPVAALPVGLGGTDTGGVADRAGCLTALGVPVGTPPLGVRRVVLDDGTRGVLFVLPTGVAGRFRVVVVGEACGPGEPSVLSEATVGR